MQARWLVLTLMLGACGGGDGKAPADANGTGGDSRAAVAGTGGAGTGGAGTGGTGTSAAGTGGQAGSAAAGTGGSSGGEPARGAIALQLSDTTCVAQMSWVLPDADAPVTETERGMLAVDGGRGSAIRARCLVQLTPSKTWDIAGAVELGMNENEEVIRISVNARVDPAVPTEGGFQLVAPSVRQDISSNMAGPCLYTLREVSEGNVWGKVECAATRERDLTECGAATIHFAFENCFTDRLAYNESR